ncbi:uncharacterized protein EAF02_006455 [Botrytis sinoallii]|uniref:uncharacterized protein n=1 Tax=Botrytis sinoallii TaxID=1463999 RepID=UPI00190206C0|nr:uncharacterized protein EAF02_006455 [Botrytis sinoallii]KAF7881767.1 hypothetical protein EAF02_006455 [Botrytis sinoallii]
MKGFKVALRTGYSIWFSQFLSGNDTMKDSTASSEPLNSRPDAEIEIVGTIQPNPISRSLPEGSTVTVRVDMTLRNSDSPLSFDATRSFIAQNQKVSSGFHIYHTDDGTGSLPRIHINAPMVDVNVDEDLMTLYPDLTVSVDVTTKVYTKKAHDGQMQQYFFRGKLSTMEFGDKHVIFLGAGRQPMVWLYWDTKEDIIEKYVKNNGHAGHTGNCSRSFRCRGYGLSHQPVLRLVTPIAFSVVE